MDGWKDGDELGAWLGFLVGLEDGTGEELGTLEGIMDVLGMPLGTWVGTRDGMTDTLGDPLGTSSSLNMLDLVDFFFLLFFKFL